MAWHSSSSIERKPHHRHGWQWFWWELCSRNVMLQMVIDMKSFDRNSKCVIEDDELLAMMVGNDANSNAMIHYGLLHPLDNPSESEKKKTFPTNEAVELQRASTINNHLGPVNLFSSINKVFYPWNGINQTWIYGKCSFIIAIIF